MIRLFPKDATEEQFKTNGIAVLDNGIKNNEISEIKNGMFSFDFEYFSDSKFSDLIKGDMIIVAPTPYGDQPFRVHKITEQIGYVKVECYHIFYDLASNLIEDSNFVKSTGTALMNRFNAAFQYSTSFRFSSDIDTVANCRMVRMNPVQALLDTSKDNTFINRWGGEILRDGYDVKFLKHIGSDRGFKISHGKNLTGYDYVIDWEPTATRIMPIGFDGLILPEKYVDSPLINDYRNIKIATVNYQDVKAVDSNSQQSQEGAIPLEDAYAKLRELAKDDFSKGADKPSINIRIQFKNLGDTKEYAQFKKLVDVKPFDTVHVRLEDYDIEDRIISYKYDAITREYIELELGDIVQKGISDKVNNTENSINDVKDQNTNLQSNINDVQDNVNSVQDNLDIAIGNGDDKIDAAEQEAIDRIANVKRIVSQNQDDITRIMNSGGNTKIQWLPNFQNATQLKIITPYGYWLLDDHGAGFHSNNGTVMNGLSADGKIYADAITGNNLYSTTITGGTISGGVINGAIINGAQIEGAQAIRFHSSSGISTAISDYGISTKSLTVQHIEGVISISTSNIDVTDTATIRYLQISGNIRGNNSGLYLQGPVYVDGREI